MHGLIFEIWEVKPPVTPVKLGLEARNKALQQTSAYAYDRLSRTPSGDQHQTLVQGSFAEVWIDPSGRRSTPALQLDDGVWEVSGRAIAWTTHRSHNQCVCVRLGSSQRLIQLQR